MPPSTQPEGSMGSMASSPASSVPLSSPFSSSSIFTAGGTHGHNGFFSCLFSSIVSSFFSTSHIRPCRTVVPRATRIVCFFFFFYFLFLHAIGQCPRPSSLFRAQYLRPSRISESRLRQQPNCFNHYRLSRELTKTMLLDFIGASPQKGNGLFSSAQTTTTWTSLRTRELVGDQQAVSSFNTRTGRRVSRSVRIRRVDSPKV